MGANFFDSIGISTDLVVIILIVVVLLQFIWIFTIISKCNKLNKRLSKFTTGRDAANLEEIIAKRFSEMRQIVKNEKQQNRDIDLINDKFLTTFCKIGLVKYDAFKEMSGKLSFSLALLTENHDGIIITSMHSREGCFTYCKEISNEESYYILSEEERLALNVATGKEGAKEAAKEREDRKPEINF
ncbi:MAG: DUF4446 family protein [Bacteroidales bacterium]|nr:DUF4446 family protein [Clostridium sp.]MCM1204293.1 DUF4446 family protein [Bacteroidales bacterium]